MSFRSTSVRATPARAPQSRFNIRGALRLAWCTALAGTCSAGHLSAQVAGAPSQLAGVVRDADSGAPLAGVTVRIVGSGIGIVTAADGAFRLLHVGSGTHALVVERLGYATVTRNVSAPSHDGVIVEMAASPLDIGGLVVTGALTERGSEETLRPVSVLAGQELQERLQATVAGTVASEPGLASATMGPGIAQPVIRGLSGDRVLVLEDGVRVADVSNTHADHPTALDPSSARRIEVVRGPAALLYGSNALGGVVNVIRDEVPTSVPYHPTGSATAQARTVNSGYGVSGSMLAGVTNNVPFRVEATGRTSDDLATPTGVLVNTDAETWSASVGTGWVDDWGHLSASVRTYRNDYGVPGGFEGGHSVGVRTEMERSAAKIGAKIHDPFGPFGSIELDGVFSDYQHTEIETGGIVGTIFERSLGSGDVVARHDGWGPFSAGAVGGRASWESLGYQGQLSTPDSRRVTAAAFLLEEMDLGPLRLEAGLRYDWVRVTPAQNDPTSSIGHIRARTFRAGSGSLGLLVPTGGGVTVGASVAQAFRPPDVGELFSEGPHLATYSFEVGNPELGTEVGRGVDAFVRYGSDVFEAEVTGFYNDISGYIYGENTGRISRVQLPVYQYQSNDAVLTGFEGRAQWRFARTFRLEGTGSYVRGTLKDTDEPLPLIPPLQGRAAIAHDLTSWFVRGEVQLASNQNRIGAFEASTDGYAVYHVSGGVRLTLGGRLHVLTLSLENLTDEVYRNHLSRVKDIMPEAGRGVFLTYRVAF